MRPVHIHGPLNTEPLYDGVESGVAVLVVPQQLLGIPNQNLFVPGKALGSGTLGDGRNCLIRNLSLAGQAGVGAKLVLGLDFPGCSNDHHFFQGVGQVALEAYVGARMGNPGRQFRAVEKYPVRTPYAPAAPDDLIIVLLVF